MPDPRFPDIIITLTEANTKFPFTLILKAHQAMRQAAVPPDVRTEFMAECLGLHPDSVRCVIQQWIALQPEEDSS